MLAVCVFLGLGIMKGAGGSSPRGVAVIEHPDHVLIRWSGNVDTNMTRALDRAFRDRRGDPRRIVLSLHSDGGLVSEGAVVIERIKKLRRTHAVDTLVEQGRHCASMCVPIFVTGGNRTAHPAGRFMFHSVRISGANPFIRTSTAKVRRIEERATEDLFDDHLRASGVNERWLEDVRTTMGRADVWFSGKELHDSRVGVVDELAVTAAR
jgi:hypothetical protein